MNCFVYSSCLFLQGIGDVHALKIFEVRLRGVAQREIDALKTLEHENIVAFMGQETDVSFDLLNFSGIEP